MSPQFNISDFCARCDQLFTDIRNASETKCPEQYFKACVSELEIQEAHYWFKVGCDNHGVFSKGLVSLDFRMTEPHRRQTIETLRTLIDNLELSRAIMDNPEYTEANSKRLIEYWRIVEETVQGIFPLLYIVRDDEEADMRLRKNIVTTSQHSRSEAYWERRFRELPGLEQAMSGFKR